MPRKLMILGASLLQLPAIRRAKEKGLYTVVLDMNEKAVGASVANEFHAISSTDIDGVVRKALELRVDGIMTLATDMPMRAVAAVGERMGLPTISPLTALKATDKARMRACMLAKKVPIPSFVVVSTYGEFCAAVESFPGNLIVKPADSSGSRGVFLLRNKAESYRAFSHSKAFSRSGEVLVEEYMEGPEVSVETITLDGKTHVLAITDKSTSGPPYFVEEGHSVQSMLPDALKQDIVRVAQLAVDAVGVANGPAHTEIIVTDDGPKIVELGARLGGDNITSRLVPLATGLDLVGVCIDIAVGQTPRLDIQLSRGAAIRYLTCPPGRLVGVGGLQLAADVEGVEEIVLLKKPGDSVAEVKCSGDRIGFLIASGADPSQAIERCEIARSNIAFCVDPSS